MELRSTFGDLPAAEACARMLVEDRLAACVQVDGPIRSTYRWQDRIETSQEWRVTCKTIGSLAAAARDAIVRGHAYELPEILVVTVETTPEYAAWVHAGVSPSASPGRGLEAM